MYKKIFFKILYILIIFFISFALYNFLFMQNNNAVKQPDYDNTYLINKQSTDPKRLFLKTWRIIKTKYYDPTLNGQDWSRWNKRYVDKIKTKDDAYVAINTMLASLDDPYSKFLSQEEYAEQNTNIDAKIVGIGVNIMSVAGKIIIISVVEGTPASLQGIKAGDIILKVDKTDVSGKTISDVASLIRGEMGTSVNLELLRDKQKLLKTVQRQEIQIKNIKASVIDKNIGYIQIASFLSSDMTTEFVDALNKTQLCEGLIIDLRGNTGGLMPNAVVIADMFLTQGHIVSVVDRDRQKSDINAQPKPYAINKPVVILIDEGTASASEILSGALKDNQKAILVGKRTFGKGMIQRIFPLPDSTGMNLTIAKYLTPKGIDINKKGITPDYEVSYTEKDFLKDKDPQMDEAKKIIHKLILSKHEIAKAG
jgi:peptidase, S41 family